MFVRARIVFVCERAMCLCVCVCARVVWFGWWCWRSFPSCGSGGVRVCVRGEVLCVRVAVLRVRGGVLCVLCV